MNRIVIAVTGMIVVGSCLAIAQQFEVVSIKPTAPNATGFFGQRDTPGDAYYRGTTAAGLIRRAYQVRDFQVLNLPKWATTEAYDISAKPQTGEPDFPADAMKATDAQRDTFHQRRNAMVLAMLIDRFQLKTHKETRDFPVYILRIAKDGAKFTGPNVKPADPDLQPGVMHLNDGALSGTQLDMSFVAGSLSTMLDRPITDKTGLTGKYNIDLKWTPDRLSANEPSPPIPGAPPTIFTALREQLGLELASSKAPLDVIVIDQLEKPAVN